MVVKTKKKRKSKGERGQTTYGHGARKKWKGSGHRGGKGMSGSGKRADQKKSLVIKLYGNSYFGKQGVTSRSTKKDKSDVINLRDIDINYEKGNLDLKTYKILGEGEVTKKYVITARAASASAIEKVEKAGGKIIIKKSKEESDKDSE
jgi:large subunit ribosomal protein L15